MSAGANGYPKKEAYEIATSSIRAWLSSHYASELDIMLVLYNKDVVDLSESIDKGLRNYLTDYDTAVHAEALRKYYEKQERLRERRLESYHWEGQPEANVSGPALTNVSYRIEKYAHEDLSFPEMCEW